MRHLPHNLQQRADELRREAHHAHVDGRSRRSAVLNHAAAALEMRIDAERRPGLSPESAQLLRRLRERLS